MKRSMLVLIAGLLSGLSAQASSQPEFVQTCSTLGLEKLRAQAEATGVDLQEKTFEVCGVDSRWYNPSKYVWYCANASAQDGSIMKIQKLVQYSGGRCY